MSFSSSKENNNSISHIICSFNLGTNFLSKLCCYSNINFKKLDYYKQFDEQKSENLQIEWMILNAVRKDEEEKERDNKLKTKTVISSSNII